MSEVKSVAVPPELLELVRESSGEPSRHNFARNFQVPPDEIDASAPAALTRCADCPGEAGAGGGVLPAGVCAADGADVTPGSHAKRFGSDSHAKRFGSDGDGTWWRPCVAGPVLAFDIETTGLTEMDSVTCVCAYDPDRGVDFRRCTPDGAPCEEFLALMDEAPLLCAFNGVKFDVPFLAKRWGVSAQRAGAWVRKLVDPFESCRLALGTTFSLNKVLATNGLECKTGTGLEAVGLAMAGKWAALEDYCMNDTILTHQLVKMPRVWLPCSKKK